MGLVRRHGRLILFLTCFFGWVDSTPLYGAVLRGLAAAHGTDFAPLPLWFLGGHAVGLVAAGYLLDRHPRACAWVASAAAAGCALLAASLTLVPAAAWPWVLAAMGLVAAGAMVTWGRWFSTAVPAGELGRVFGWAAATVVLVGKGFEVAAPVLGPAGGLALSLIPLVAACALGFGFSPAVRRHAAPADHHGPLLRLRPQTRDVARFALFITFYSLVAGLSDRFFIAVPVTPYTDDTLRLLPYAVAVVASGFLADRRRMMTHTIAGAGALAVAFAFGAWADPTGQYVGLGLNGLALGLLESAPWLLLAANAEPATAGRWFGWGLNLNVLPIFLGGVVAGAFRGVGSNRLGVLAAAAMLLAILSLYGVRDPLVPLRRDAAPEAGGAAEPGQHAAHGLTAREMEVAALAMGRMPTRDIAARLFISENTVKTHLRNVFRKTGATSRGELRRRLAPPRDPAVAERHVPVQ